MMITVLFVVFTVFSSTAYAEKLKLLVLPLSNGTSYIFSANLKTKCTFEGVNEIQTTQLKVGKRENWLIENVNFLQNKINLEIDSKEISANSIVFILNIAKNLKFEFSLDKSANNSTCTLKKILYFNDKIYDLDEIYIEYTSPFFSPVIKKIHIANKGIGTDLYLYPWALHGQISTYELNAGGALNIHSNIRVKNQNIFEKNDPTVEPIPAFLFRYGPFFLSKDGLGSLIFHYDELNVLVMGLLEGEPYLSAGLHERKKGIFLGSMLKYKLVDFFYYNDFLSDKGYNLKLNLAPEFYADPDWKFIPQIFVQYWDKKYVDYYFGVKSDEQGSGMKPFQGRATVNFGTMLELIHYVDNWMFSLDIGVKSYGREVYTSPTVVKKNEVRFITSVLYKIF